MGGEVRCFAKVTLLGGRGAWAGLRPGRAQSPAAPPPAEDHVLHQPEQLVHVCFQKGGPRGPLRPRLSSHRERAGTVGRQLGGGQRDSVARSDDSARTRPGPKDGFFSTRGHVTPCSGRAGRLCRNSVLSRSHTGCRGAAGGTTLALSHRLGNLGEAEEEKQAGWEPRAQRLSFSSVKWSNSLFPVPRCQ